MNSIHHLSQSDQRPSVTAAPPSPRKEWPSVLAWPAWARALAVAPALGLLWVAVVWATAAVVPL